MDKISMIGVDLGKRSFQLHGVREDGSAVFRKKVSRDRFLAEVSGHGRCTVAMEACGSAHYWGRELREMGFEVRLVPPIYVKPFVKRHKNDAADAEAVCEASSRPGMRFVAAESADQQAEAMLFRTRDLLTRQRTQTVNALRGHLAEHGVVAPQGIANVARLAAAIDDPETQLPELVRDLGRILLDRIEELGEQIGKLDAEVRKRARASDEAKRLMTIPGIGPICAMAIQAFAPPMESFRRGRDFSAWLGLVPRQCSTGGKPRLGRISKMGQRDLRRLLVAGAIAVIRWASRRGTDDPWLAALLNRKPPMLAAAALANRMARVVWAVSTKKDLYRAPAAA